jgi:spore maturation protein SpmB
MFPTLLGLMVAVSMLSNSKVLEAISRILTPILINIGIVNEKSSRGATNLQKLFVLEIF